MKVLCPAEEEEEGEGSQERKRQRHGEVDVEEANRMMMVRRKPEQFEDPSFP